MIVWLPPAALAPATTNLPRFLQRPDSTRPYPHTQTPRPVILTPLTPRALIRPMSSAALSSAQLLAASLKSAVARVESAAAAAGRSVRLVAVSKLKPAADVQSAYDCGHRVFGENYVQELLDKAPQLPADIHWHFIGHLQTNKVKSLLSLPNLACVESVDRAKLADALNTTMASLHVRHPSARNCFYSALALTRNTAAAAARVSAGERLRVRNSTVTGLTAPRQVNTSGEESKSGCGVQEAPALAQHIISSCPHLLLRGLMTIGMVDYSPNPECFARLLQARDLVAERCSLQAHALELSMGMSGDFEQAISMGATNVRLGSTIFGAR